VIPANEEALRQTHPALLEELRSAPDLKNVEIKSSRRGPPTLVWTDNKGIRKFLHSQVDPVGESRKVAESAIAPDSRGTSRALLIGHGVGHEIRALADRVRELWVLAANLPLLRFLCDHADLSDIFLNPRVKWIFGNPSKIGSQLNEMFAATGAASDPDVAVVIHPPFLDPIPPEFERIIAVVRQIQSGRDTEDLIRPIAEDNFRKNFPALGSPGVSSLFGCARGRPVIVCGAGPTLDTSLDMIHRLRPAAYLIAVDTVAEGLAEGGLAPDLVVSIDPRPDSCMHFKAGRHSETVTARSILVFTPTTCPDIVRLFEGRRLLAIPKNHFLLRPAESILADKGILMSGGSVSVLTAALAAAMDPAYVCLAGIDFRSASGRFYSKLSSYLRSIQIVPQRFITHETTEHEILSNETQRTSTGVMTPRLQHYASDFRLLLKQTPVPFYSLGPAPMPEVRSGGLPCLEIGVVQRPLEMPPSGVAPSAEIFNILGISP